MKLKKNTLTKNATPQTNISSDASHTEKEASIARIISEDTPFDVIEAYKATRTNIMFSLSNEKGCKKIVLSSATSGEGKTTTCINLSKTFAEVGAKVLIVAHQDAGKMMYTKEQICDYLNEQNINFVIPEVYDVLEY